MASEDAFNAISDVAEILINESDESTIIEILQTMIALAHQSNTTEIPPKLSAHKTRIVGHIGGLDVYAVDKLSELFRYYRQSIS